ncbi:MAG: RluA family pseudouridine synthase, partial [Bdellovibrionales bacterium]|nr:RluA family pseudouridine synthase [Bdellovibrionales bacterium]
MPGIIFRRIEKEGWLEDYLNSHWPSLAEELLSLGCVYLNGHRALENKKLMPMDLLRLHTQPKRFPEITSISKKTIIFENDDFVIVDKPPGIPTHATLDNYRENLLFALQEILTCKLFPVQRLDIGTSGLCLYGKSAQFHRDFQKLQRAGLVYKEYRALTDQPPPTGMHLHFLQLCHRPPHKAHLVESPLFKKCELEILEVHQKKWTYCSHIRLITGRTHQIRAQLSALGSPIVGDGLYGSNTSL